MNKFFYYNSLCSGSNTPSIFSIDPYVTAIKELLMSELKQIVFYIEKLRDLDFDMNTYSDKVIEFIAVLIINLDFTKDNTFIIIEDLYENKKMLEQMYISACDKLDTTPELFPAKSDNLSTKETIIKSLNEKEQNIEQKKSRKYLYEIMLNIVLNACNNLIEIKSYGKNPDEAKNKVLKFLNISNIPSFTDEELKNSIKDFAKNNYETTKLLYKTLVEKFGPIEEKEVQICTKEGRAILVSGNCFAELEKILKAVEGLNINVYSYHEMISAFQYKKFAHHPNFAGHYSKNGLNVQSDFASFPGPVFVSKNSMPKIDIIRGRIFTSAKYPSFGISKIENDNFDPLIKSALETNGFEENKVFQTIKIGWNKNEIVKAVDDIIFKFKNNQINNIIIIGLADRFNSNDAYTKEFLKLYDEKSYMISFAFNENRKNFMYVNSYFDFGILYELIEKLIDEIPNINKNISVILSDCNTTTISHIFNFVHLDIKNIFLGPCCPNVVNPLLTEGLTKIFNIKPLTNPKDDFETITGNK